MRFIKEITLFAPSGTLKRFQGLETSFKVEQGKISALISESELTELRNGNKTMYSRLYSAEQTVNGLDKLYTDISGKYDAVSGQYTDLESKTAEYKESVDGFSANLTKLSEHVRDDYSTTEAMQAYVKASIEGFESTISQTYVTTEAYGNGITDAKKYADTQASGALSSAKSYADDTASGVLQSAQNDATSKANAALEDAKADVMDRLKSYPTTAQMNSAITQKVEEITLSVSKTYVTTETYGSGIEDTKKYAVTQASGALSSAKSYADDAASGVLQSAQNDATSKANAALEDAKADVTDRLKSYSTTAQMNSAINAKADAITLSVSKTYATTKQFDSYKENMGKLVQARIDAKADSIQAWIEDTSFQDSCINGDFSDGIHYWTDAPGYKGGVTISTDENYGKYAAISAGYIIGQEIAAGPQRLTITFDAKTMMSSGSQVTIGVTEAGSQVYDLTYNKWEHFSMTIENLSADKKHTITFKASKSLCNVCITNIKILENASDYASARIQVFADKISSTVQKGSIISSINQSAEKISINASKIEFEGLITANETFKIDQDGSMEATAGTIGSWDINNGSLESADDTIALYGGKGAYLKIGNAKLASESHAATVKYGLWIYAGTNQDFTDGTDEIRFYNLRATTGNTLGIAKDKHIGTIASSSKRYKDSIGMVSVEDAYKILDIPVVEFKYKEGYLYRNDELYEKAIPGFYAEEVNDILPLAVIHDEQGRAEDWNQRILFPLMVKLIQDMDRRIKELERT